MTCRARYKDQLQQAHDVFEVVQRKPHNVTNAELAEAYVKLNGLIEYAKDIGKHGYAELLNGKEFPGFKLVAGRSTRKWADEESAKQWLLKYGVTDIYKKQELLGPAGIEKLYRSLKKDEDFKRLIVKPPGKPKMVDKDDKRPEIKQPSAKEIFNDIK